MNNLKQSFSWWCMANRGATAEELLRSAAQTGYAGVELIDEELWPLAKKHGLQIASHNGHGTIEDGLNRRENAQRIEAELLANIRKAEREKIPVLICFSGNRIPGLSDSDAINQCAETLSRVLPAAADAGVTLAMELLNSKVDHKGYQCDRTAWGVALCEQLNSPNFKLLYDIYHMQIMEGDVIRTIREHSRHIAHYHTAGNPGRGQPDETQELYYPAIYRAIAATGYQGFVGHEFFPPNDNAPAALARAFADLKEKRVPALIATTN